MKKFESFGPDGPYCKFLFPNDQLKEFQQNSIGIFISIAFEVAYMEGKTSLKNYEGVTNTNLNTQITQKCREIIEIFSGAETHQVHDIMSEILHDPVSESKQKTALTTGISYTDNTDRLTIKDPN